MVRIEWSGDWDALDRWKRVEHLGKDACVCPYRRSRCLCDVESAMDRIAGETGSRDVLTLVDIMARAGSCNHLSTGPGAVLDKNVPLPSVRPGSRRLRGRRLHALTGSARPENQSRGFKTITAPKLSENDGA
jgi:hypothetical protein